MNNRTITYLIIAVVVAIGLLLLVNTLTFFQPGASEKYLSPNTVRGVAVEHNKKLYTLNFEQQNELLALLNRAVPTGKVLPNSPPTDAQKIIIYQFNQLPDIVITPIGYIDDELLFTTPTWNSNSLIRDISRGELKKLLSQTYDS